VASGGRLGRTPILRQAQDDTVARRASSNADTVASGDSFNVIAGRFNAVAGRFNVIAGRFNVIAGRFNVIAGRFNVILSLSKDGRAEQVQL